MQHGMPDAMHVHAAACHGAAAANSSAAPMTVGQAGITHTDTRPSLQLQHISCTQCSHQQRQNRPAGDKEGQQAHPISSWQLHTRHRGWLQAAQPNPCFHEHPVPPFGRVQVPSWPQLQDAASVSVQDSTAEWQKLQTFEGHAAGCCNLAARTVLLLPNIQSTSLQVINNASKMSPASGASCCPCRCHWCCGRS
jgi:hypothetical protein